MKSKHCGPIGKRKTKVPWHMKPALKDIRKAKKKRGY